MAVTRSALIGGPAYTTFNAHSIQWLGDLDYRTDIVTDVISASLFGDVDEIYKDLTPKLSGTPLFYDTAALSTMFPYIASVIGAVFPGASDLPAVTLSTNGDQFTIESGLIGKMPDFTLGVDGAVLGPMEIWGVPANSTAPGAENAYYASAVGQSYAAPAVASTALLQRQEFTAAWSGVTGFTSFQAQDKWTISHDLKLEPVVIQGRVRAFKVASYRCMAKCMPLGPTAAQIDAACGLLQNAGSGLVPGQRLSAYAANLVITGAATANTWTIGNAVLKTAGYKFGGKPLRQGELGWVSTNNATYASFAGGSFVPALALA